TGAGAGLVRDLVAASAPRLGLGRAAAAVVAGVDADGSLRRLAVRPGDLAGAGDPGGRPPAPRGTAGVAEGGAGVSPGDQRAGSVRARKWCRVLLVHLDDTRAASRVPRVSSSCPRAGDSRRRPHAC